MAETTPFTVGTKVPLAAHVRNRGVPISGATVTVELRRLRDGKYFDWIAAAAPYWKTSGGQREQALPEKSWKTGLYQVLWDQSVYDNVAEIYTAVYRVTDPVVFDEIEVLVFDKPELALILKLLKNKSILDILTETSATHTWFDDDKLTEILKHNISISGSAEIREPE